MDIVSTCIARDLPVYRIACERWRMLRSDVKLHAITRKNDFRLFHNALGDDVTLWDEDSLISEMTIASLRRHPLPFFPAGAGWYFQQILKWGFAAVVGNETYLIWDADTIPLRNFPLTDDQGRTLFATAAEHHEPYFQTYQTLFGNPPVAAPSFIAQHQLVRSSAVREMINILDQKSSRGWAWAIIENLQGAGTNLFSEYETYGQFMLANHPDSVAFISRSWTREGRKLAGQTPSQLALHKLSHIYDYISFESNYGLRGRIVHSLRTAFRYYR